MYYTSIPENSVSQTTVLTLQATDLDDNPDQKLIYKIKSGDPQGFFLINELTGSYFILFYFVVPNGLLTLITSFRVCFFCVITTTDRKLDRESQSEHVLEVSVTDNGHPSLSSTTRVIVNVVDYNDHAPMFLERLFRIKVSLCQVVAKDKDAGLNAEIDYSILLGKQNGRFKIDSSTGIIYSKYAFTAGDEYELSIKASDMGLPRQSTTTRVLINVIEAPKTSENAPVIKQSNQQHINIMENDEVGRMVTLIEAEDADGDQLWYAITDANYTNEFMIRPDMGDVLIARKLDMEKTQFYNLTINVNDHRPEFSKHVYYANVTENAQVGTEVVHLNATDKDEDRRLVYAIHSCTNPASMRKFRIDTTKGILLTTELLDREIMHEHHFTIVVKDSGTPSKRSYTRVHITVLDHNDHTPDFMIPIFKSEIHETAEIGTVVLSVRAIDRDQGNNAMIRYSVVSGNVGNVFNIDSVMGDIKVAKQLSKKTMPEYFLMVKASDQGTPPLSSTVPVHIIISLADNAPPLFDQEEYAAEIHENQLYGTYITHVSASSKSSIYYEIISGNSDNTFNMDPNSGVLTVGKPLDYETKKLYNLEVLASNLMKKSATCKILIHILDKNDNPPRFLSSVYMGNISESASIGGVVLGNDSKPLVVTAVDGDSDMNSLLSYEIIGSDAASYFSIDSNTGAIRTTRLLDREKMSVFEFKVQVWDSGSPRLTSETSSTVYIEIIDVNDCIPKFEAADYNATLLLPTYKDVVVTEVKANDDDSPSVTTIVYTIIEGNNHERFKIGPKSGVISVKEEDGMRKKYNLVVSASDGKFSSTSRVHILVKQAKQNGFKFAKDVYIANINENSTDVSLVGVLSILGNSLTEDVKFYILNPNKMFEIGITSGRIMTTGIPFDRETQGTYTLVIEARSKASIDDVRIAHVLVHVSVLDINDNSPVFMNLPYYSLVALEAKKGDFIQKVEAIDLDIGINGEISYELVRGHEGKFRIDSQTGEIFLNRRLQHEQHNKEFKITVAATDKGKNFLRSEAEVSIRVINKNMPVFSKQFYSVAIPENLKPHSPVISIMATSPQNRKLIYAIVGGDVYEEFVVHFSATDPEHNHGPCVIHSVDFLDQENKKLYSLTLRATDSVIGTYAEVPVSIKITDVNDNPPQFTNSTYNITVSESTSFGSSIYRVTTTDRDLGVNGRVQYHLKGNDSILFHMDPEEGSIYIKRKLDYELKNMYHFVIVATDMGTPSLSTEAHTWVYVEDMNDNPPIFEHPSYYCYISEHAQRNQFITKVLASDPDISDYLKLHYAIVGGNSQQSFTINSKTGVISLTNLHKFTKQQSYTLNISVSDGVYTSFTRVVIELLSTNHNTPQFSRPVYDVLIGENSPSGKTVFTAVAKDDDRGKYGHLSYAIQSDTSLDTFKINSATDRENQYLHEVPIVAVDDGGRTGYTLLRVTVGDINDNAPQFQANEYKANIHANMSVGTTILTIRAIDKDQGAAGTVEYSLYEGDIASGVANQFGIRNQVYQFFVRAKDKGKPPMETDVPIDIIVMGPDDIAPQFDSPKTIRFHKCYYLWLIVWLFKLIYFYSMIKVMDENDNAPVFESNPYHVSVAENAEEGLTIVKVVAQDLDSGNNQDISYSFDKGSEFAANIFSLDSKSGWISTLMKLDRETMKNYTFSIVATDNGIPRMSGTSTVFVTVQDYNDNPPIFSQENYIAAVNEDALPGTVIITVSTSDVDSSKVSDAPIEYYMTEGDIRGQFGIRQTGEVFVSQTLDREITDKYDLVITATDGTFVATCRLLIDILDANDNPPVCIKSRYSELLLESTNPGTFVLTIEATDADEGRNAKLIYKLKGIGSEYFSVDESQGYVKVAQQLDRETNSKFELTALVQDSMNEDWFCSSSIEIALTDVNDNAPVFSQEIYTVVVSEDVEVRTLVAKVHANDKDIGINRKISYSLQDSAENHFSINSESGILMVRKSLDRETAAMYNLTVQATDHGTPSLSSISLIMVIVKDINDNPPEFAHKNYFASVSERSKPGTAVIRLHATSKDIGINGEITYSILVGNDNDVFSIHPKYGVISVNKKLDYEKVREYFLYIQAQDGGILPLSSHAKINISVSDANDNPPIFNQDAYSIVVPEDIIVGDKIIQTMAGDIDSGINAKITYHIVRGDDLGQFTIDQENGYISVVSDLDRELNNNYVLEIQAHDKGLPTMSSSILVKVEVSDVNDNPPRFAKANYSVVLQESKPVGSVVVQFSVTDIDEKENGPPFTFSIVSGNEAADFKMGANGQLLTATKFNHRHQPHYLLKVKVYDAGMPPMSSVTFVSIQIIEESQYSPEIMPLFVEVGSYLDQFPGGRIGKIKATDRDLYDKLIYKIVSNHANLFTINENDGSVIALEGLDVGLYEVNVSVSDGKFDSYGLVTVSVSMVTDDMLKNSVTIRIARLTPEEFITLYRKRFLRTLKNILSVRMKDIEIISIQPAYSDNSKQKRQTKQDLDVLIAVKRDRVTYFEPNNLRRIVKANVRKIKSNTKLEIAKVIDDRCDVTICNFGQCVDRLILDDTMVISITTDDSSYVSPQHHQRLECICDAGYGGDFCEIAINKCADEPCPKHRLCVPDSSTLGYRCICQPGKTGARCDMDAANCHGPRCHIERNPMSFRGTSYARYTLFSNIERHLTLSMYVRTVQSTGCLMFTFGPVDYGILEMVNGQVQYKFDCGTGEGLVRAEHVYINDGNWHEIKLERHGSTAELIVDNRYRGTGSAPGHNDVLNSVNNDIWFGAEVRPHPTIPGHDDIRMGFYGCMDSIKIDHISLPLHITSANAIATLKRSKNVEFQCYETFDPGVCGSQPCRNGGTCNASKDGKSFTCNCHYRFMGLRCEVDTNPCASNPCLYDGICHKLDNDYRCECKEGLSKKRCDFGRHCNPNPCQNAGICEEGTNSAICKCKGFQGEYCTMDINECIRNPCKNSGTCINVLGSFECLCTSNTTGHLCGQHVTTPNIKSDSSNIYFDEKIGLVLITVVILLIVFLFVLILKRMRRRRREKRNNEAVEMTSNEIIKNKTNENSNRISKMSNLEASYPVPPSRRVRPASFTASTHDSYTALNNFDTVRSYGSAADDLENIPRYSQDFMQSIIKPLTSNDVDCDDLCKSSCATWDANLKDSYPEEKIQNDLKQKKHPISDIPPPLQALNNMTVHHGAIGGSNNIPGCLNLSSDVEDYAGYHWDCSDWARSQNPLPNITEVSRQEVSDSPSIHSNESNTHIDAALPLLEQPNRNIPKKRVEGLNNPRLRHNDTSKPGENTRLLDSVCEYADNSDVEDGQHSPSIFPSSHPPNFETILNDLENPDRNGDDRGSNYQPPNPSCQSHPDEYLPHYNIGNRTPNSDSSNNQLDDNKYSLPRRRHRNTDLDDLSTNRFSMEGYASGNGSCSDMSQNLCEIEDSEVNYSDNDSDNISCHSIRDTRL
ncbi:Fat-like cadherin-related tumor suppressor [Nymphon striatum]|nr:Fat-like cadherin-related tumor suppressor [Nymphon striatum]